MPKSAPLYSKNYKGQSIVEVVLSIGIAALVIGALVILGTISLRTAISSTRRTEATKIAISGLEAMRYIRDTQGFSSLSSGCYQISTSGVISKMLPPNDVCTTDQSGWQNIDLGTDSDSKAIFNRKIKVEAYGTTAEQSAGTMLKVTVTVRWPEGSGTSIGGATNQKDVVMSVVLSSWNQ